MDELDELTDEARQRRTDAGKRKADTDAEAQNVLDQMDGHRDGRTAEQVAQDRADRVEADRIRRLLRL